MELNKEKLHDWKLIRRKFEQTLSIIRRCFRHVDTDQ